MGHIAHLSKVHSETQATAESTSRILQMISCNGFKNQFSQNNLKFDGYEKSRATCTLHLYKALGHKVNSYDYCKIHVLKHTVYCFHKTYRLTRISFHWPWFIYHSLKSSCFYMRINVNATRTYLRWLNCLIMAFGSKRG